MADRLSRVDPSDSNTGSAGSPSEGATFSAVLDKFFTGMEDHATLSRM
jgi:hypothetical protein